MSTAIETKHTPGPWRVKTKKRAGRHNDYVIEQERLRYPNCEFMDSRIKIAVIVGHRLGSADNRLGDGMNDLAHSDEEGCASANAHLIASAPRLLEKLQCLLALIDHGDLTVAHGNRAMTEIDVRDARAAIACVCQ